jgi:hypothetical protein
MKLILIVFFSLILIIKIHPQNFSKTKCDSCATLFGKVLDSNTKEPLVGANVLLELPDLGAATDIDGHYIIKNIRSGMYNIKCSYIGYMTQIVDSVLLASFEKKEINIEMVDEGEGLALEADEDIKNGDIKILIGGLPVFCAPFDEVNDLCEEYGFKYELMGCSFLWTSKYNEKVYKYLDEINGEGWKERFEKELDELCKEYSEEY